PRRCSKASSVIVFVSVRLTRPSPRIVRPGCRLIIDDKGPLPSRQAKGTAMPDAFLLSAVRTPIGKYLGGLAEVPAPQLGAVAVAEALRRARAPAVRIDEV